ncbi:MAG: guanine-specific ribonuclease [Friedmanniella sp.]|nr:guanine-specific ribonuclease [Friedmanniella sp.]
MSTRGRGSGGPLPAARSTPPRTPRSLLAGAAALAVVVLLVIAVSCGQGTLLGTPTTSDPTTAGTASRAGATTRSTPRVSATSRPPSTRPPGTQASATVSGRDPESGLPRVALTGLPLQARQTADLIDAGGPFPYSRDGVVFGNRERILPIHPSGWYHEYTVPTPGSADRGARRLITGDGIRQLFYTGDHYASFVRVVR